MADSSSIPVQSLSQRLQVLAATGPSPFPVVSLYLNLATGQNGRAYLDYEVNRSSQGLALFACAGAGLFEAVQMDVPIDQALLADVGGVGALLRFRI